MGALRASAMSWAFWLTLPFRVRIPRIASLKLFCLPRLVPPGRGLALPLPQTLPLLRKSPLLRACQRSLECRWDGKPSGRGLELGDSESSMMAVSLDAWKGSSDMSGNLYVVGDGCAVEKDRRSTRVEMAVGILLREQSVQEDCSSHVGKLFYNKGYRVPCRCCCDGTSSLNVRGQTLYKYRKGKLPQIAIRQASVTARLVLVRP